MHRGWRWVVAVLIGLWASPAWAKCPTDTVLKKIGTIADASGSQMEQIVDGPMSIDAFSWQCTGTACTWAFYDGDPLASGEAGEDRVVLENGAVASGGDFEELDGQLRFNDGVSVWGTNLAGVMAYTCQPV